MNRHTAPERNRTRALRRRLRHVVLCAAPCAIACKAPSGTAEPLDPNTQATNLRTGANVPIWGGEHSYHLGEKANAAHYSMTFSNVKECAPEPYFPIAESKVRLGVEVTIEGTATAEVPVNPFYATLVGGNGVSYESSLAGCTPSLRAVRVTKGTQATGWISFEVPKNLAGPKMIYRPVIIGAGVEELHFDLSPAAQSPPEDH